MKNQKTAEWKGAYPGLIAFVLLLAILFYPTDAYESALSGLHIFLQSVFPALLPFFIASEMLTGLGVVDFLSVLLNPVMGPLFRCPGSSSFIWVMSITSGYPTGARLTAQFCKEKRITTEEAQRILSFCSTSGPLFMVGAVAIGMLGSAEAGNVILASHYLSALIVGFAFRYYKGNANKGNDRNTNGKYGNISGKHKTYSGKGRNRPSISQALSALNTARKKDGRPIGQLMAESVGNSVNTLLVVCGYIIFFSVVIALLLRIIDNNTVQILAGSLLEVTTGCKLISQWAVPMQIKITAVSFVIGWSGLSIQAQSAGLLSGTGVNMSLFLFGKLIHGLLAGILSIPLTGLLFPKALETTVTSPVILLPGWRESLNISVNLLLAALIFLGLLLLVSQIVFRARKKAVDG